MDEDEVRFQTDSAERVLALAKEDGHSGLSVIDLLDYMAIGRLKFVAVSDDENVASLAYARRVGGANS